MPLEVFGKQFVDAVGAGLRGALEQHGTLGHERVEPFRLAFEALRKGGNPRLELPTMAFQAPLNAAELLIKGLGLALEGLTHAFKALDEDLAFKLDEVGNGALSATKVNLHRCIEATDAGVELLFDSL